MNNRLIAALLLGTAVATMGPVACEKIDEATQTSTTGNALGIRTDWMDASVDPGDDFFRYANGGWLDSTEIPADRSSVGGFYIADQQTEKNLAALIGEILKSNPEKGTDAYRVKAFYEAYLDTKAIDTAGLEPLQADLARFERIADKAQLAQVLGSQARADVDPLNATDFETENLFGIFVTQALKGGEVVPYVLQGGLGMPEREYYLSSDEKMAELRSDYRSYIADLLKAAKVADADAKAQRIFDLEMKIAQGARQPRGQRRLG